MRNLNWTVIALLAAMVCLVLLVAYSATSRNSEQDKLTNVAISAATSPPDEKRCSSNATLASIKRELFRRAAQLRGSSQSAYDQLARYAVLRTDNAVMESEDSSSGTVNCSGSVSLDLPPGVAVAGGRRSLMADVDYTVDANGNLALHNADAIIAPLARLVRIAQPAPAAETNEVAQEPEANVAAAQSANVQPGPPTGYPGRPSFDCSRARSRGEIAVCSDGGLSALDLNMATQYRRALSTADPGRRELLERTGNRFLAYRDRCPNRQCIADAYLGRMREIRDIMEARWRAPG